MFSFLDEEKVKIYDRLQHFKKDNETLEISLLEATLESKLFEMLNMVIIIFKWNRPYFLLRLK